MHIPDGFLSPPVWATLDAVAIASVAWVARRAQRASEEHQASLLGVMGAFVFAAQMINFPVGVGTSGHLVGGALLAFTVGPYAASVVLTAILILQSLIFQDGGVLALGANVTNMALAGVLAAYLPYRILVGRNRRLAYFVGGTLSLMISAALALSELLISGVKMPGGVLALSLGLFAVSAVIEGAITVAIMQGLEALNPAYIRTGERLPRTVSSAVLLTALVLVTVGFLLASTAPDGIWSLAGTIRLSTHAHPAIAAPLADYRVPFFGQPWLSRAAAGIGGLLLVYAICLLVSRLLRRRHIAPGHGV